MPKNELSLIKPEKKKKKKKKNNAVMVIYQHDLGPLPVRLHKTK